MLVEECPIRRILNLKSLRVKLTLIIILDHTHARARAHTHTDNTLDNAEEWNSKNEEL